MIRSGKRSVFKRPAKVPEAAKQNPRTFKRNFTVAEQAILGGLALDKTPPGRKKFKEYLKELEAK